MIFLGWNNQLVMYNPRLNELSWPKVKGDIPCPRAAHVTVCNDNTGNVYLFGGRFRSQRLNDLYIGNFDLSTEIFTWNMIYPHEYNTPEIESDTKPRGRSWHSMNIISNDRLIIYGGFSEDEEPLNDCWFLDLNNFSWIRVFRFNLEPRLWHTAHYIKEASAVFLIGGCTRNIFDNESNNSHPNSITKLIVNPLTLSQTTVDYIAKNNSHYQSDDLKALPVFLQEQIQFRKEYQSII